MPKHKLPHLLQLMLSFNDREEAIANQRSMLGTKHGVSVGNEYFAFRVVGRMKEDLANIRIASHALLRNL